MMAFISNDHPIVLHLFLYFSLSPEKSRADIGFRFKVLWFGEPHHVDKKTERFINLINLEGENNDAENKT
ncbi:hypothetical protein ACFL27_10565 [candidate division CSSED10-310 bacterium]|uniref:Uncharacterized protein n=1 Tax=candidate division CSSED10-310 bacterium TaxID=2855610 RepID=A0ABV6YWT6_UNCC1